MLANGLSHNYGYSYELFGAKQKETLNLLSKTEEIFNKTYWNEWTLFGDYISNNTLNNASFGGVLCCIDNMDLAIHSGFDHCTHSYQFEYVVASIIIDEIDISNYYFTLGYKTTDILFHFFVYNYKYYDNNFSICLYIFLHFTNTIKSLSITIL